MQINSGIDLTDNIIEKLQLYMKKNNHTMHGLASAMGFDYQPFYRLMTKKSLPTLSSLNHIAQKLNCTVAELIAEQIFIDLPCFSNLNDYLSAGSSENLRVYLTKDMLQDSFDFFAVKCQLSKTTLSLHNVSYVSNTNIYQMFLITPKIHIDGFFLVKYNKEIITLEVLSISSKLITANYNGSVIQIPVEELVVYAQFLSYIELPNPSQTIILGKKI